MHEQIKSVNFRTDLADEQVARLDQHLRDDTIQEEYDAYGIKIIKTKVGNLSSNAMGKKAGIYYTLDLSTVNYHDASTSHAIEKALVDTLDSILQAKNLKGKRALVIGLGNVNVTPDSLGPYVLDNIVVTRHLVALGGVHEGYSEVSGISPGVMGTTGIETYDIISAVKDKAGVDFLVVVDALAAASLARVNKTIQISDSGISPGSGVGNARKEISQDTMGMPVIAIGVPTVVDAATITSDTIDYLLKYLEQEMTNPHPAKQLATGPLKIDYESIKEPQPATKEHFLGQIGLLSEMDKKQLLNDVLAPNGFNMMVTPKEVDEDIEDLAKIIATGIDLTLHDSLRQNFETEFGL